MYRADERWDVQCFVYIIAIPRACQKYVRVALHTPWYKMTKQQLTYHRPYINKDDWVKDLPENTHHILAKSQDGSDRWANKIKLYTELHDALHRVFGNGTPQQQLVQLLNINWKALTLEFQNDILKILEETDQSYYYKDGVYLPKK